MAFFKGNFLSASEFQRSAKIGQPLVLEADLTVEGSSTKSWAAGSRRFWTLRTSNFGLHCDFSKTKSGDCALVVQSSLAFIGGGGRMASAAVHWLLLCRPAVVIEDED